jgi:uncharacterized surface protein with fasciclin (FAS1) repeats
MFASTRKYMAATALLALAFTTAACSDDDPAAPVNPGTIVDVAASAGTFNTLVAAVEAAGLAGTLSGPGPFTVFAPTDAAFAKLPAGTVEALLQDPAALAAILTYHVVQGRVTAADVVKLTSAATVNGQSLSVEVNGATVRIGGATVTATDIAASNGIIHVIDTVLIPNN